MERFRFAVIGLLVGLWVGWGQVDAFAQRVYWTEINGKIQSSKLDGTDVTTVFDTLTVLPPGYTHPARPGFMVVDPGSGWIYWTDLFSGVHRVKFDGTGYQNIVPVIERAIDASWSPLYLPGRPNTEVFTLNRGDIQGTVLDRVRNLLYWGPDHPFESPLGSQYLLPNPNTYAGARIRMSNTDGSGATDVLAGAVDGYTSGLAIDFSRGKMYFSSPTSTYYPTNNNLYWANLDGTNKQLFFNGDGSCDPRYIQVDEAAGKVYWSCGFANAIWRANVDGSNIAVLVSGLAGPSGFALDTKAGLMYVAEPVAGEITRRKLLDGALDRVLVTEATANPQPRQICPTETDPNAPCPFFPSGVGLDLTDPTKRPDMIVSNLSTSATSVGVGGPITVTDTTKNQGSSQAGATRTFFYLSTDATLDSGDSFLGSRSVGILNGGGNNSGSTPVTIPISAAPGAAYIIALADGGQAVWELNENNNTRAKAITVTPPPSPDLAVTAISAPASAAANSQITVTDTTKNQGNAPAGASTTAVWFSTDGTLATGTLLGSRSVGVLNAGASNSGPTPVTIPANALPGTYYLILVADAGNSVAESDESDNTTSKAITIPGPDLAVTALSAPASATVGSTITIKDTTKNQGTVLAGASTTSFYLSVNNVFEAGDTLIASRTVGQLAAGASSNGSATWTIPAGTAKGIYYIIARADDGGAVAETDETDNTRALKFEVK